MKTVLERYFSIVKRFVPDPVVKPTVGIDVGSESCKMVEVQARSGTYTILNWAIDPIKGNNTKQALQNVLKKLSQPTTTIATSISGKGTLVRYIDMPRMSQEDLKRSFALEADKYFPFPKEQIYTDCYILDKTERDNKMAVMVAAAKKEIVDQRIELLKELGLQPDLIMLDSIAVSNAINILGYGKSSGKEPNLTESHPGSVAILDLGKKVSNLSIIINKFPRFSRDIFIGGHDLTSSISNGLGLSLDEAEKVKCQPGDRVKEVLEASDSVIMNLVSELRLSFDYFITEKNVGVSQLLLTGGASILDGLPDLFAKYLEIPVQKWNPLESVELAQTISPKDIKKNIDFLGAALGLALEQ